MHLAITTYLSHKRSNSIEIFLTIQCLLHDNGVETLRQGPTYYGFIRKYSHFIMGIWLNLW
jgi:hypothetical protein